MTAFMEMSLRGAEQRTLGVPAGQQPRTTPPSPLRPRASPPAQLPLLGFRAAFVSSAAASTLAELAHMPCRSLAPSTRRRGSAQKPRAAGPRGRPTMGSEADSCDLPRL